MKTSWPIVLGLLLLATPAAQAQQFDYTINADDTITITSCSGFGGGGLIIPGKIDGLTVTGIGYQVCNWWTGLTIVTIPSTVISIGEGAFAACSDLTAINVDTNNPAYMSVGGVLFNKSQTTLVLYPGNGAPSYTIPASVTNIGAEAFEGCNLTEVIIPASVTSIGEWAFGWCWGLTDVIIPGSLTSIGYFAFEECGNLNSMYFQGNAPTADSTVFYDYFGPNGYDPTTVFYLPGTTGWSEFSAATGVPIAEFYEVIFTADHTNGPAALTVNFASTNMDEAGNAISSWNWLFGDGSTSTNQNPSYTFTNVGTYYPVLFATNSLGAPALGVGPAVINVALPFNWITNNGTITITGYIGPGGPVTVPSMITGLPVTSLASGSLCGSTGVSMLTITIPSTVTNIDGGVFYNNYGLNAINVDTNNQAFVSVDGVLFNHSQTKLIQYPIGNGATSYVIPNTVTTIGDYAFWIGWRLNAVTIPSSVESLGVEAFGSCWYMGAVYFQGNAPTADPTAFDDDDVTAYYLPGTTGWSAFTAVTGVPAVELGGLLFTASATNGLAPLTVNFTAASVDVGGNAITNWNWSFGDGSTSTNQNPSHTFTSLGVFHPVLLANNSLGDTLLGSGPDAITLSPPPSFGGLSVSGNDVALSGSNGISGSTYYVLTSADLTLPLNQWVPMATTVLSAGGNFSITVSNGMSQKIPQQFYILQSR